MCQILYTYSMKIVSWNVNGIRAVIKKGALQPMLDELQPDILCLQETKIQPEQIEFKLPESLPYAHWHSAEKKGYSSTAILSKTKPLSIVNGFSDDINKKYSFTDNYGDTTNEGRVTTAEFDDFYLVTVYTPNSKGDLSRLQMRHKNWDPAFLEHCQFLEKTKPVIFCGDLNVAHTEDDLARPDTNHKNHGFTDEEREGFQNFLDAGFVDTFRIFTQGNGHYSWWTPWRQARERNVGWRIDYFLVSASLKEKIKSAEIHPMTLGSDHCPVSIKIGY